MYLQTLQCALLLLTSKISASKISPSGRDIHLETLLQYKASSVFLPNCACFSEAGMPHSPCSWSGSDKAVHIAMAHAKFPSSEISWYLPENPSNRILFFLQVPWPCNIRLSGSRHQKAWTSCAAKIKVSREQPELQQNTAEAISPQGPLQAKHAGSCCPQSLLLTGTTRFPSRLSSRLSLLPKMLQLGLSSVRITGWQGPWGPSKQHTDWTDDTACTCNCSLPDTVPRE